MAFSLGNDQSSIFSKLKKMTTANRLMEFSHYQSRDGSTPFSLLTPTQFAELFPKYYMQKMPDVGGFYKALSSQKSLGGEGKTYGPHGNTGDQTATPSSGGSVTNIVKAKEIYDYIRSKGVDHNHAVGIINNMKYESSFNSGVEHVDNNGKMSGGLFQHNGPRYNAMTSYVGADWKTNWKKQIDFAMTEGVMKKYLATDYSNAADASRGFTLTFENPWHPEETAASRMKSAQGYSDAVSGSVANSATSPSGGSSYEITSSGYVVPKDKGMYTPGNEQQCATLAKGFNPEIGRSSSWSVVPGEIKPGVAVATMRYNLPGGDRTGSGYHSGIAMSAPDKDGNFLLLEQFNGQPARVRQVNIKYGGGAMGGSTEFGLISSNGKLHTEQSMEALNYGARISGQENQKIIQNNAAAISNGNTAGATQGVGSVSSNVDTPTEAPQTNIQQQETVKSIQTATIGDMMRMVGDLAGFFMRGEGIGGANHHKHHKKSRGMRVTDEERAFNVDYDPNIGSVAQQFEGRKGVETVSSGLMRKGKKQVADPGGVSYGAHQLSSRTKGKATGGTMAEFLKSGEGKAWSDQFKGMMPGSKQFTDKYNEIISNPENKKKFAEDQHKFIYKTHYVPIVQRAHRLGYDVNDPYVKEALYSASVQYRNAARSILARPEAMAAVGKPGPQQASAIYDARNAFGHGQFASRMKDEKIALAKFQPPSPKPTAVATAAPTAAQPQNEKTKTMWQKFKETMGFEGPTVAKEAVPAPETKPVQQTMPDVKNPAPLGAPILSPDLQQPAAKDKQSFNVERPTDTPPSKPIVADAFMSRNDPQFSSPSAARAIGNTYDPSASNSGHSFLPKMG